MIRRVALAALALVLGACGTQRDLAPLPGHQLPPPPLGRADRPTPAELLTPPTQAVPNRADELRTRSEERADDPFDLPPAGKAAAPPAAKP